VAAGFFTGFVVGGAICGALAFVSRLRYQRCPVLLICLQSASLACYCIADIVLELLVQCRFVDVVLARRVWAFLEGWSKV